MGIFLFLELREGKVVFKYWLALFRKAVRSFLRYNDRLGKWLV